MTSRSMPRNRYMVAIVFLTFFVMSLLTNILGPIVPDIIDSFKVSLAAAAFLPFSFFIAHMECCRFPPAFGGTLWREARDDRRVFSRHGWIAEFCLPPQLWSSRGLAVRNGIGNGNAANRDQPSAAGRRRGKFCLQFRFCPVGVRQRLFLSPHMYSYMVLNLGSGTPAEIGCSRFWPKSLPRHCRGLPCIGFSPFSPSRWLSSFSSAVFRAWN